jgi:hypothetical protein
VGGPQGSGVLLDVNNSGTILLSTNIISGGQYGINAALQTGGTQIWAASNTIVPAALRSGPPPTRSS